jgi:hypothetical protein
MDDQDLKPPADFVAPPVRSLRASDASRNIGFDRGFYPIEVGGDGRRWRWMGGRGEVRLANDGGDRRLRISGWVPLEFMSEPPTIRIELEGHLVETFVASKREFTWDWVIGRETIGASPSVVLRIETSRTARAPGDPRDLGLSIQRLDWDRRK